MSDPTNPTNDDRRKPISSIPSFDDEKRSLPDDEQVVDTRFENEQPAENEQPVNEERQLPEDEPVVAEVPVEPETPRDIEVVAPASVYPDFPEQDAPPLPEPDEPVDPNALRPRKLRAAAIVGVRVVAGTVGLVVAAAVVAGSSLLPLPNFGAEAPSALITPVPTAQQLVCAGGLLRLASGDGADASTASSVGEPLLTSATSEGEVTTRAFAESEASTGGTAAAPQALTTPPGSTDSASTVLLAGSQLQNASSGDLVGLAASSCDVATGDSWLVGGSTATGRTTLLTLNNPSEVPATVDIEIFGEGGAVVAPGMTGITVAPDGQRVFSIASFAPDVVSPVVHVTSRGGQVVSGLQQSIVRGIEAGGVDTIGSSVAPSETNVIPGVTITGTGVVQRRLGESGFSDLEPVLRLYVPGEVATRAYVDVIPENGVATGADFEIDVQPGIVTDFPIDDLVDGNYTVRVSTDLPVVAAMRISTAGSVQTGSLTDFAWLASAQTLATDALVSVVPDSITALHIANSDHADAEVTVEQLGGTSLTTNIPAGASIALPAVAGASYRISGGDALHASISALTNGGLASYGVRAAAQSSAPILIYP